MTAVRQTSLWALRLDRDLTLEEWELLLPLLPPERRERLFRVRPDAPGGEEVLCAYGLLTLALHRTLHWEELPRMALSETGKPWFPSYSAVRFSLSHTPGAVMAGLSGQDIGVDVEKVRPVRRRLMERAGVRTEESFFRLWVELEARGKRTGRGVVPYWQEAERRTEAKTDPHKERPFRSDWGDGGICSNVSLFPGYAAAAAVSPGETIPEARTVPLGDLLSFAKEARNPERMERSADAES